MYCKTGNILLCSIFLKKKTESENELKAIADGRMIPLSEVKDEVFSQKIMGDGVAFSLEGNKITAPCSGTLSTVFPGGHAYGITRTDGVEILIHIGVDTVALKGEGFNVKVKQDNYVKQGELLCTVDNDFMKSKGIDTTTMMIFTDMNGKKVEFSEYGKMNGNESVAAVFK